MFTTLLAFTLLLAPPQVPKVSRIFVATPYNASIIFEYANAAIPEDEPLRDGAIDCLVSELKATSLFTDIRVTPKPIEGGQKVNIEIEPVWSPRRESFVIEEIVFEGFTGIDEKKLARHLRQKGLMVGTPLFSYPMSRIKVLVGDTVQEMTKSDPQMESVTEEMLSNLSLRIIPVASEKVRLLVVASGLRHPCQQ